MRLCTAYKITGWACTVLQMLSEDTGLLGHNKTVNQETAGSVNFICSSVYFASQITNKQCGKAHLDVGHTVGLCHS